MKRSAPKLAGAFEKLGRNAFEKLGNAIAETATAITESHMANPEVTTASLSTANPVAPRITANPAATMASQATMGNLMANPATITASQVTITENPKLATATPPMAIPLSFPG